MLRDNKKTIPYPGYWAFIGGSTEENETREQALIRETKEEVHYNVKDHRFFKKYTWNGHKINMFYIKGDYYLSDFKLGEGQKNKIFS